jgi:hypothetical protein
MLGSVDDRLAEQNSYLKRLADHFAPEPDPAPVNSREQGVDFLNPVEAAVVQDYVAKTMTDTGREPSEDEILRYLADEKTVDLQSRLALGDR